MKKTKASKNKKPSGKQKAPLPGPVDVRMPMHPNFKPKRIDKPGAKYTPPEKLRS
jgi:hypothetical protein